MILNSQPHPSFFSNREIPDSLWWLWIFLNLCDVFPIHLNLLLTISASVLNPGFAMVLVIVVSVIIPTLIEENDCFSSSTSHFCTSSRIFPSENYWSNDRQRGTLMFKTFPPVRDLLRICCQPLSPPQLQRFGYWGNHNDMNTEMTKSHSASYFNTHCVLQSTQLWEEIRRNKEVEFS